MVLGNAETDGRSRVGSEHSQQKDINLRIQSFNQSWGGFGDPRGTAGQRRGLGSEKGNPSTTGIFKIADMYFYEIIQVYTFCDLPSWGLSSCILFSHIDVFFCRNY